MKKLSFLAFFMFVSLVYSQKKSSPLNQVNSSKFDISLSSGISSPSSNFSDHSFASSGSFTELSGAYYFSKIGLGVSLGQYTNPTDTKLSNFTNSLGIKITNSSKDWKTTYYGIGPEYKVSFNKFSAKFLVRTGILSIKPINLKSNYTENVDVAIPVYNLKTDKTSKISYFSTAITMGYNFTRNLGLFITADYLSALSKKLTITESRIPDINKNGLIDAEDFKAAMGVAGIIYDVTSTTLKPQATNFGVGIKYSFSTKNKGRALGLLGAGSTPSRNSKVITRESDYHKLHRLTRGTNSRSKRKRPGRTTYDNITLKRNPIHEDGTTSGKNPLYVGKGRVAIVLTNPAKEKAEKKEQERKLINVLPKNNSNFNRVSKIESFSWKQKGSKIPNPQYIIEIVKIGKNQQPTRTYIGTTTNSKIAAKKVAKFKAGTALADTVKRMNNSRGSNKEQAGDGQYRWKVTETTTGISSNPSFFTIGNCEIDFTISNDTIECLGYEGSNRKFKICFDATYASTSGDLTFVNMGSGLSVFDQSYTSLSYTLVSPNLTLITQTGATVSTVSYCFEVTVPSSVTSIGFGLQGDDLDPSPIDCIPGVSALFDELPSCLCNDCEDIEVSFDDFNISMNGGTGNQFNFNGNMNVNVPIYGIEFQIQSYTYSAAPSACTEGVSSIEESGMLLMPGTSINGSTALQLFNETASGSASSNNNATKDIKYTSNSPITGPIPVNLTIGLPGPISGLDPSCCVIEYTVCIKVKIFYEEGNCKSCVFTHCFQFNNQ